MKHRLSSGFVWFDIWSVPQIDCAKKKASTLPRAPPCELLQPVAAPAPAYTSPHLLNTPHPAAPPCARRPSSPSPPSSRRRARSSWCSLARGRTRTASRETTTPGSAAAGAGSSSPRTRSLPYPSRSSSRSRSTTWRATPPRACWGWASCTRPCVRETSPTPKTSRCRSKGVGGMHKECDIEGVKACKGCTGGARERVLGGTRGAKAGVVRCVGRWLRRSGLLTLQPYLHARLQAHTSSGAGPRAG